MNHSATHLHTKTKDPSSTTPPTNQTYFKQKHLFIFNKKTANIVLFRDTINTFHL